MSRPSTFLSRLWLIVPVCAIGFLCLTEFVRVQRVRYVTGIGQEAPPMTSLSPTGYAGGTRELVVPEHLAVSYEWVAQTQRMLATGQWRSHEIDYENAPYGRAAHLSAPYRWWLGLVAWADHLATGKPLGAAVESAAVFADPVLHLFALILGTIFVARHFGALSSALFSIALVTVFPLAAVWLPATPDDFGLVQFLALSAVLLMMAGIKAVSEGQNETSENETKATSAGGRRARAHFFASGVIGGIGVWINVATMAPLLTGIAAGGLAMAWLKRRTARPQAGLWRVWAIGGSGTVLLAYLIEYFPRGMDTLELRVIHPLYGVAWLGAAELVARAETWAAAGVSSRRIRDLGMAVLAFMGAISVPLVEWLSHNPGFLAIDLMSFRLTKQPDAVLAPNVATWITRDGASGAVISTLLVVVPAGLAIWFVVRRCTAVATRCALTVLLSAWCVTVGLAYFHLRWWAVMDVIAIAMIVVGAESMRLRGWSWALGVVPLFAAGVPQLFPARDAEGKFVVTVPEVESLIERDLGHWLTKRVGPDRSAIVLAPPNATNTLYYYGAIRGLGTLAWENKDGLSVALRIMISNSPEEAHELFRRRGINYVVLPTWEPFFDTYANAASVQSGELFLASLRRWAQPNWLRPLPYVMPSIPGFEQHSVLVFEVANNQGEALALCRELEYFIEMGQAENARAVGQALKRFPMDFGASVARAQLDIAMGTSDTSLLDTVIRRLNAGGDRALAWDLRVSLADLLARAKRFDEARTQTQRCLADATADRVRELTPSSLYHLLGLAKGFGLQFRDPTLHDTAFDLLPSTLRERL